jgi:hypothetical protein
VGGGCGETGIGDYPAEGRGGLSEGERVEFYLGEANLTEGAKNAGKVSCSFFADGVELDSVEELGAG